ncbi:glycerate kinase [candidate division WOR-3 bacterium]|nr:glycerate kinase [candidate division WOR-3 bacterium]
MKILVAPNCFKESLTSIEVARHIGIGLRRASKKYSVVEVPLADGGTGTTRIITTIFDGDYTECPVTGPMGDPVTGVYGSIPSQRVAIIELAQAAGLSLVHPSKRNPMISSTRGVGQMLMHALSRGYRKFIIGIGDSATIDCGSGALFELGIRFLDCSGNAIEPSCSGLMQLRSIDTTALDARIAKARLTIASDVKNVLTGRYGAIVYAKQKGARSRDMPVIRRALRNFKKVILEQFGTDLDTIPGSGAAGGIGGAFVALLKAQIVSGFGLVQEFVRLEEEVATSDIVITGEGRIDEESMYGKTLKRVVDMAYIHKKPVILIAGSITRSTILKKKYNILACYSLLRTGRSKKRAIEDAGSLLERIAYEIGRNIREQA